MNRPLREGGGGLPHRRGEEPVVAGDCFGQWCWLSDAAKQRIVREYKRTDHVRGRKTRTGEDAFGAAALEEATAGTSAVDAVDVPVQDDAEILYFEDIQDRLPFKIERGFNIFLYPHTPGMSTFP